MKTLLDEHEVQVYCAECNGYLWSLGADEAGLSTGGTIERSCPYVKDPLGRCTGRVKSNIDTARAAAAGGEGVL